MAEIDIFNIKPNVVTRDLSGKSFFIYGGNKTGKTTMACKFPRPLLLGFEKGYGMIPGIHALPINSWSEAILASNQLIRDARDVEKGKKPDTTYKTIVIDTAEQAEILVEKYICDRKEVEEIGQIPYGGGWKKPSLTIDEYCQNILKAGYTLVVISHAQQKQQDNDDGTSFMKIQPSISDRTYRKFEDMVDIFAYVESSYGAEDEAPEINLVLRGGKTLAAGSRYPYLPKRIPFTYEALQDAMMKAVDKIVDVNGEETVTTEAINLTNTERPKPNLLEIKTAIRNYYDAFKSNCKSEVYRKIVGKELSVPVSQCGEDKLDLLSIVLSNLELAAEENGIVVMNVA